MAPLPVISNVFRVAWNWTSSGGLKATNVLNVRHATGDEASIATAMNTHASSLLFYGVADAFSVTEIAITALDGSSAAQKFTPATPANWDGGTGGQYNPAVAGLVSIRTAQRGPRGRGRIYLPYWAEGETLNGKWNSTANQATCQGAWDTFVSALDGDDIQVGVASYVHADFHVATQVIVELALATQRPRQDRVRG